MTPPARTLVPIALLGPGAVGRSLLLQIAGRRDECERRGIRLAVAAVADRDGLVVAAADEIDDATLDAICRYKAAGGRLRDWSPAPGATGARRSDAVDPERIEALGRPVVVDTSAASTRASLLDARARGWRVVLANKIPLVGSLDDWDRITLGGRGARWETTVAAALPVIAVLRSLLDQGDRVRIVTATLSGTLGAVAARLEEGRPLGAVVREAVARGWTEPDPRVDLSGLDVARKALILARMTGLRIDLADVRHESLYPTDWDAWPLARFLEALDGLDATARFVSARSLGAAVRYQATVVDGRVRAGWVELDGSSPVAAAGAANSVVILETERFASPPLVLSGRAGGPDATAAGVLGDLLDLAGG